MTGFWDHSKKPSMFVVKDEGIEIYRGRFKEGFALLNREKNNEANKTCEHCRRTIRIKK